MFTARQKRSGLTFIELLVTVGMTAIISTFLIGGFRGSNENQKFQNDAESFFANIRLAQNNALSGIRADVCTNNYRNSRGWYLMVTPGSNSYQIGLVCSAEFGDLNEQLKEKTTYVLSTNTKTQGVTDPCPLSSPPCAGNNGKADCDVNNNYFFLFAAPYGNLKFFKATGGSTNVPPNGWNDIITTSQIGIKLQNSKVTNLAKGIGLSPAGGTVLKNLSSSEWDCGASWTAF